MAAIKCLDLPDTSGGLLLVPAEMLPGMGM